LEVVVVTGQDCRYLTAVGHLSEELAKGGLYVGFMAVVSALACGGVVADHKDRCAFGAGCRKGLSGPSGHFGLGVGYRVSVDRGDRQQGGLTAAQAGDVGGAR
jgi:hypothetical protein